VSLPVVTHIFRCMLDRLRNFLAWELSRDNSPISVHTSKNKVQAYEYVTSRISFFSPFLRLAPFSKSCEYLARLPMEDSVATGEVKIHQRQMGAGDNLSRMVLHGKERRGEER
jgi:hypothetical protein